MSWVQHPELVARRPVHCVDGRATGEVIGTPGGTLGELIAVLTAYERLTGTELDRERVSDVTARVREVFGRVYHHSDAHAVEGLGDVRRVAPAERERALAQLLRPEHTGCGHLAGMLRDPDAFGVRRELVEHVLRAFFHGLWRGDTGYEFEVLDGVHDEAEVLVVHSCGRDRAWGRTHAMVPLDTRAFVYHRDAARWYRRQLALLLVDGEWLDATPLIDAADPLLERQLEVTLSRLAPDLPRRELEPPCETAAG